MGIIALPDKAYDKSIPCHGFLIEPGWTIEDVNRYIEEHNDIPAEQLLLWKEGVIGTLSNTQDRTLCRADNLKIEATPPKLEQRLNILRGLKKGYPYCLDPEIKEQIITALKEARPDKTPTEQELIDDAISEIAKMPVCQY